MFSINLRQRAAIVGLGSLALGAMSNVAGADGTGDHGTHVTRLLMPIMSSSRGMKLYVEKGCYSCHSVNGVGGEDASPLDAHEMGEFMNPFDLAAKMWTMASIMIPAQEEALGAQIEFTGDELADIIAFLHDDDQQHMFKADLLSPEQMAAMHHEHGGMAGEDAHAEELGHTDADTHDESAEASNKSHDDSDAHDDGDSHGDDQSKE